MRRALPLLLVLGAGLLVGFEDTVPRLAGLICLFAFIGLGVWLIASPDFLGGEES